MTERTSEPHHRMRRKLQRVHYAPKRSLSRVSSAPCLSSCLQRCSSPANSSSSGATRGSFRACACKFQTEALQRSTTRSLTMPSRLQVCRHCRSLGSTCRWDKDALTLHYSAARCETVSHMVPASRDHLHFFHPMLVLMLASLGPHPCPCVRRLDLAAWLASLLGNDWFASRYSAAHRS